MDAFFIAFCGIFLGCLCRLIIPYLRKAKENPTLKFDPKYLITFVISVIFSLIAASVVMASYQIPPEANNVVFFSAFVTGWGSLDILNEILGTGKHE